MCEGWCGGLQGGFGCVEDGMGKEDCKVRVGCTQNSTESCSFLAVHSTESCSFLHTEHGVEDPGSCAAQVHQ